MRLDDINPNTDFIDLKKQIQIIRDNGFELVAGINLFGKTAEGTVYPDMPLCGHENSYFMDVDNFISVDDLYNCDIKQDEIVSHGMIHADHSKLSKDAQEMSILVSCSMLGTKRFIPPFNRYNDTTLEILKKYDIELVNNDKELKWHSLENLQYDSSHEKWYYHPWRINSYKLKEKLNVPISV